MTKMIINKCLYTVATLSIFTASYLYAAIPFDYVNSVKVNGVELNQALSAQKVESLLNNKVQKVKKEFSECSGNYEFSTQTSDQKTLKFEIFSEDNPSIQSDQFYKNKSNFQQLGTTKGNVWLTLNHFNHSKDEIWVGKKKVDASYSVARFKQDFPNSAKNKINAVLLLNQKENQIYLNKPDEFELGYTAAIQFHFKNGKLTKLEINQAIAC
ncbi:hypothetical protein G8D99_05555 [Acinetobacter lanii]|uniref:Uncharacterized protein n=2 Tax=Acinetobacter lanii TaxID=2715163 RepID=A0A6G8S823_9GAMM|nr:hypothetical protein G8D99_05555 [Acinetobacter lanii]